MNGIVAWWVRNGVAANLLMFCIFVAGAMSFGHMSREVFPAIRTSHVEINVSWPGASPQEMEEQVVMRIEAALTDMEGIDRVQAYAGESYAAIWVVALPGVESTQFMNDVKTRVDSISSLPRDIEPPSVTEVVFRDEMMRIAVSSDQLSEKELKDLAEQVRDEVSLLPNISLVELFGARQEEVSIELSEESLRRYNLTFDEVAQAIRGTSVSLSSGSVRTNTGDVQLRARNLAENDVDFANIVVRQSEDGGVVRVGDVARVIDGFEEEDIYATLNGEPAVLVQILTNENPDVVAASQAVNAWLDEARLRMPEGVNLTLWWDTADIYKSRMSTISRSALSGLLLVCIVLLLTLRPKVAAWVTVGIATAYAGAFILLPMNDVTINFISTFSFLLVLGIVVDDAIVVGESIHRTSSEQGGGMNSAIVGTQLVLKPVFFAVITSMIAFAPWLFITSDDAQLVRQISVIVICALTFSLIEAFFILPSHLSNLKERESKNWLSRTQHKVEHSIVTFAEGPFQKILHKVLDHRFTTLSVFVVFLAISFALMSTGWLRFTFMPDIESDEVFVTVELPDGTPYSRSLEVLEQLQIAERQLVEEVQQMAAESGESSKLIENWYTRSRRDNVLAIIQLVPPEERTYSAKQAADRLRELVGDIPDADRVSYQYTLNGWSPDIEYSVSHQDLDTLQAAVAALKQQLSTYDTLYEIRDSLQAATEELRFKLLPGAENLGLTLAEVSRQVRQAYYGEEVQRLARDGDDVRVMVRYPEATRNSISSLQDFRLRLPDGREVPLFSVAEVEYFPGINQIERRERLRSVVVSSMMTGDDRSQIDEDLEENFFPEWEKQFPGVVRGAVGQAEGQAQFMAELSSLYIVALFAIYALIAIAFKSYWHPLLVMTAIPFGFMGAIYGHLLWGMSLNLFSYFGIGAAAGVVVNDNLVLLDAVHRNRDRGLGIVESVVDAAVTRFRPILLTSVTTFVGLVPMMMERSIQAQFLIPTVVSLAFGVLAATFVTLLLVPALYVIGENGIERSRRLKSRLFSTRAAITHA